MRLAIPIFGSRVSPRFDCSQKILLVDVQNGVVVNKNEVDTSHWHPLSHIGRLYDLKPDIVICGNICTRDYYGLSNHGIRIIPSVFGQVEEIIRLFLKGNLITGGPGFGHRRHRHKCMWRWFKYESSK
ncbi:MAG TPA: hypothetical protein EYP21_00045 [Syntrophaceae bacterium]|nr:hypothetical protein [Syntrophaceae bacterium]